MGSVEKHGSITLHKETGDLIAERSIYVTKDGRVVPEDDPEANVMVAAAGQPIPKKLAQRYGLKAPGEQETPAEAPPPEPPPAPPAAQQPAEPEPAAHAGAHAGAHEVGGGSSEETIPKEAETPAHRRVK